LRVEQVQDVRVESELLADVDLAGQVHVDEAPHPAWRETWIEPAILVAGALVLRRQVIARRVISGRGDRPLPAEAERILPAALPLGRAGARGQVVIAQ